MGIQERDYMREPDSDGNIPPRPSFWDHKSRTSGLETQVEDRPIAIENPADKAQVKITTKQRWIMGGVGALASILIFTHGMDFLMLPSQSAIAVEKERQERLREERRLKYGGSPRTNIVTPTAQSGAAPSSIYDTADPASPMNSVEITGNGLIRLVDMTGTRDYKVLRLRSLYNPKLVGTAVVRPGENLGIKVPYEHPFRVTAITTPIMPSNWAAVTTSSVTVDLGVVSAMPDKPGVVAMGAEGQAMAVISNDKF